MTRDSRVWILGEDVGPFGGINGVTGNLYEIFGEERVRDTPISESAIIGCAVGAAMTGMRPVAEIMMSDFMLVCSDQLFNQAAKIRYMFGGKANMPMVVRMTTGGGRGAAAQHSQSLEAIAYHFPGILIAMPATPYDAKGLLKQAIRQNDPTIFLEHKLLYRTTGVVPEEEYTIPFGVAAVKREGADVTVIATSLMVARALESAEELAKEGISCEIIDPRTIKPLDMETILDSVKKTQRAVVIHEACLTGGVGADIGMRIMEQAFSYLRAPVKRIASWDTPQPFSIVLEQAVIPQSSRIIAEIRALVRG
jgi:pyruvate dehydrogenase E1 component beta subunit